jgi:hypothetical protein
MKINVDIRRKAAGLQPLAAYLKTMGKSPNIFTNGSW